MTSLDKTIKIYLQQTWEPVDKKLLVISHGSKKLCLFILVIILYFQTQ